MLCTEVEGLEFLERRLDNAMPTALVLEVLLGMQGYHLPDQDMSVHAGIPLLKTSASLAVNAPGDSSSARKLAGRLISCQSHWGQESPVN